MWLLPPPLLLLGGKLLNGPLPMTSTIRNWAQGEVGGLPRASSRLFNCLMIYILTLLGQAAQLAYMMEDKLKDAMEEADKERALKDVAENAKAWARGVEKDQAQTE
nr:hypothetical protein CFP56_17079 [Quercus suber]